MMPRDLAPGDRAVVLLEPDALPDCAECADCAMGWPAAMVLCVAIWCASALVERLIRGGR